MVKKQAIVHLFLEQQKKKKKICSRAFSVRQKKYIYPQEVTKFTLKRRYNKIIHLRKQSHYSKKKLSHFTKNEQ